MNYDIKRKECGVFINIIQEIMVFSSMVFLWSFLPIVFWAHWLLDKKYKNLFLLLASLAFYAWGEPGYIVLMIASIFFNYLFGRLIAQNNSRKKIYLYVCVCVNIGLLIIFKYANFITLNINMVIPTVQPANIALPIGISFYTFQILSYIIDVYRGDISAQKNVLDLGLYISLFPQLIAGPIVKYRDIEKEIKKRSLSWERTGYGVKRFLIGLSKKVLIANVLAQSADAIFSIELNKIGTAVAWLGAICYTLQIYYDFSGYSDMAIGMGHMFGFKFAENFNYPYISRSIKEFWRRWHISLSSWFKEYLYIPLGGNRKGIHRTYLNLLIVFIATGFWHGANWTFLIWGLFHGILQLLERGKWGKVLESDKHIAISHVYTMLMVIIGWVIFRADSLAFAMGYLAKMFWIVPDMPNYSLGVYANTEVVLTIICGIVLTGGLEKYKRKIVNLSNRSQEVHIYEAIFLMLLYLLCICSLASGTYNPFIYFRF